MEEVKDATIAELFGDISSLREAILKNKHPILNSLQVASLLVLALILAVLFHFARKTVGSIPIVPETDESKQKNDTNYHNIDDEKEATQVGYIEKPISSSTTEVNLLPSSPASERINQLHQGIDTPMSDKSDKSAPMTLPVTVEDGSENENENTDCNQKDLVPITRSSSSSTLTTSTSRPRRKTDGDLLSCASPYSMSSSSSSFSALTTNETHREILQQSITNPGALLGWKISVEPYGIGVILAVERIKFHTTRFVVEFPNNKIISLPLKRSAKKGSVAFHLIEKAI